MKPTIILFNLVFLSLFFACSPEPVETVDSSGLLLADSLLPDYEKNLDHARLISNWSEEFYHKGMITYREVCFNCHGNVEQPGSIPNSMRFWEDEFKHGADPFAMYQTLTKGFGLMAPQMQLTPQEKYEVIHFIREEFIKEHNPDQYFKVSKSWLAGLPKGDTIGPDPQPYQPWAEMDYGNFLMRTYELANSDDPPREISGGRSPLANEDYRDLNFAYKGIAMRLDEGEGGVAAGNAFVLFDHDLLRFTGFWTGEGFIDWQDILLNDRHNIYPRTVGEIEFENPITPGWANPSTGEYTDPRFVAVDGRPFGPLPKDWAHYKGLYYHGNRVVIKYTVGTAEVLETYDLVQSGDQPVISRTLNIAASPTPLSMRIAPVEVAVELIGDDVSLTEEDGFAVLKIPANRSIQTRILLSADQGISLQNLAQAQQQNLDLSIYTKGGPKHYSQVLSTPIIRGAEDKAYAEDVFTLPQINPWNSRMRPTGIDFLEKTEKKQSFRLLTAKYGV